MRAMMLSLGAALSALAGAAEARTIDLGDIIAHGGGAVRGARISVLEPEPAETLLRADARDRALGRCLEPRGAPCLLVDPSPSRTFAAETMLAITLEDGFSLRSLSFNEGFGGKRAAGRTVIINGVAYRMSELSALTLTSRTIFINLDALAAQNLSLRSFDLEALATPLPAAGLLMLAGLGGLSLARSVRKKA